MADHASKCQKRDASVDRAYYDANGHHRVRHAYVYCGSRDNLALDQYGYAYCADHRAHGDFGRDDSIDLDAVLHDLLKNRS